MSPDEHDSHRQFLRSFTAHEPAIRTYVRRLLPSRADADDVMQEVSVVLWEKFDRVRDGGDFRSWAFGVARYEVLTWLRDRGRDRIVLDESVVGLLADEGAEDEPHLERQREALEACMHKLTPGQRNVIMLAYQPGARIWTLARRSGRTVAGFYQWLYRVRRTLLDCIRQNLAREDCP